VGCTKAPAPGYLRKAPTYHRVHLRFLPAQESRMCGISHPAEAPKFRSGCSGEMSRPRGREIEDRAHPAPHRALSPGAALPKKGGRGLSPSIFGGPVGRTAPGRPGPGDSGSGPCFRNTARSHGQVAKRPYPRDRFAPNPQHKSLFFSQSLTGWSSGQILGRENHTNGGAG